MRDVSSRDRCGYWRPMGVTSGVTFRILPGLPPYGAAVGCPSDWGHRGKEGFVVRFEPRSASPWVGNFRRGPSRVDSVLSFENGSSLLVVAGGAVYQVDPERSGPVSEAACCVTDIVEVPARGCFVFGWNHVALSCWGPDGLAWQTRRVSWDGLRKLRVDGDFVRGEGWSAPDNSWVRFEAELLTGNVSGGASVSQRAGDDT